MKRSFLNWFLIISILAGGMLYLSGDFTRAAAQNLLSVSVPTDSIPEGLDFATLTFGNAWDMSEFTDISQYLNGAGRHPSLTNISHAEGVFSARSIADLTTFPAAIHPLFAGYAGFMQIGGNLGSVHPVASAEYDCLYFALKTDSPDHVSSGTYPDNFRVIWSDETTYGMMYADLYPETTKPPYPPVIPNWRLYKVDLNNPANLASGTTNWSGRALWKEIQINPTIHKDIDFQVDWIRLTTCSTEAEHQAAISWNPDANLNTIWARPSGTNRNIMLETGIDGTQGNYSLNTKGLAAGVYQIGLGTLSDCCTQWSSNELTINQTPTARVVFPSATSGTDYATLAGNPWDMDPSDIDSVACSDYSFSDGVLNLSTLYPAALPDACKGPVLGEADSRIYLNMPGELKNAREYRYLSFRLNMEGAYSIPADGMIGRFMWTIPNLCTYVTADIPYEVGWNTYVIDLYDPHNGTPIAAAPSGCPIVPWSQTGEVVQIRFDPNENWTGNIIQPAMVFAQHFDWISLSKTDRVAQGQNYSIGLQLNKSLEQISEIQYYYTNDQNNPVQNSITRYTPQTTALQAAAYNLFLPSVSSKTIRLPYDAPEVDVKITWDTSSVAPGEYYICAKVFDGKNESAYCSEAPIQVYSP